MTKKYPQPGDKVQANQAIGKAGDGVVQGIPFAPDGAQIFREYLPQRDSIEYTIFWREDGRKKRMDYELTRKELEGSGHEQENYILQLIMAQYDDGKYVDVLDEHETWNAGFDNLPPEEAEHAIKFESVSSDTEEPLSIEEIWANNPEEPVEEEKPHQSLEDIIRLLVDTDDPFAFPNAPGLNLIVNMRIYDVLLGLYLEKNPERAKALMDIHAAGKILGSLPTYDPGEA